MAYPDLVRIDFRDVSDIAAMATAVDLHNSLSFKRSVIDTPNGKAEKRRSASCAIEAVHLFQAAGLGLQVGSRQFFKKLDVFSQQLIISMTSLPFRRAKGGDHLLRHIF
jgi:hypothetical protein